MQDLGQIFAASSRFSRIRGALQILFNLVNVYPHFLGGGQRLRLADVFPAGEQLAMEVQNSGRP